MPAEMVWEVTCIRTKERVCDQAGQQKPESQDEKRRTSPRLLSKLLVIWWSLDPVETAAAELLLLWSRLNAPFPEPITTRLATAACDDVCRYLTFTAERREASEKCGRQASYDKHPDVSSLLKQWKNLKLKDSVLYITSNPSEQPCRTQLVLPEEFWGTVLESLQDRSGHLGIDKTHGSIKASYESTNWEYSKNCPKSCWVVPPWADGSCVHRFFWRLNLTPGTSAHVLVVADHYTGYVLRLLQLKIKRH